MRKNRGVDMTVQQAISKYKLVRQERDCFGITYNREVYTNEEEKNNVRTIWTVDEDELAKEEGESIYYLTIQKIYYNQEYINKYGNARYKTKTTVQLLQ